MSLEVFPEEMTLESMDWVREIILTQCEQVPSSQLKVWIKQKGRGKINGCLSSGAGILFASCPWTSELQVLQPLDSWTNTSSPLVLIFWLGLRTPWASLVLQLTVGRVWYSSLP
jgi:hypothetical protein